MTPSPTTRSTLRKNGLSNVITPARETADRRHTAARQAAWLVVECSAAARETPLPRPEGGPHRHARSTGDRFAADLFRRRHQVCACAARCRQDLYRVDPAWRDDEHR